MPDPESPDTAFRIPEECAYSKERVLKLGRMIITDTGKLLPTFADLQLLLERHESTQFTYSTISDEYLSTLTYAFPDHHVSHRVWDRNLAICPSVSSEATRSPEQTPPLARS